MTPQTYWSYEDAGHTQDAKKEVLRLFDQDVFLTPKPEKLVQRILHIATIPGDLVLDSFLGSGTTAAVAHKMGRHRIGVEMGEHAVTHCGPRLQKVVEGDQSGISEGVGWKGGGRIPVLPARTACVRWERADSSRHRILRTRCPCVVLRDGAPWDGEGDSPLLGIHDGQAWALLYNGVLGDKRPGGGNVLTRGTLALIREKAAETQQGFGGPLTVYGEPSRLAAETLEREGIVFKQTPYDIGSRA